MIIQNDQSPLRAKSASGQTETIAIRALRLLLPATDIAMDGRCAAWCHKETRASAAKPLLLDGLVGATEQCDRKSQPKRFRRLQINNELDLHRLLNR
jgi:hypothetical protein